MLNRKDTDVWIYESPDGGKTVTKRKAGTMDKILVEDSLKYHLGIDIYQKVVRINGKQE